MHRGRGRDDHYGHPEQGVRGRWFTRATQGQGVRGHSVPQAARGGGNLQAVGGRGVVLHDVRGRGGGSCDTPVSRRVERGGHNRLVIF